MAWQADHLTKKAFREDAIGKHIADVCFSVSIFPEKTWGTVAVEGPYPVHRWYATVDLENTSGKVLRVR